MKKEMSTKNEYEEMRKFILSLESDFLEQSDELLKQKKGDSREISTCTSAFRSPNLKFFHNR